MPNLQPAVIPNAILSPFYRDATRFALCLQFPIAMLSLLLLDGGTAARVFGIAMSGFWTGAGLIACRRPWNPTRYDLLFWKWGFLPCLVFAGWLAAMRIAL